jgi:hypothetical protein
MHLEHYQYRTNKQSIDYEFESIGPIRKILKVARFTKIGEDLYNFGFGDVDPTTGNISDTVVSNNSDGDKVLATVAKILVNFFTIYPNADVFMKGTNEARTRRYQMGISKYIGEISHSLEILGYYEGEWIPFKKGINFQAFVGRKL